MEKEIMIIEGKFMGNIRSVALRMLELAKQGYIVKTIFNDTPLTTENASSVEDILIQREVYEQKKYDLYINSPQYKIDKEILKKKELEENEKTEFLLQEFENLDLNSVRDVVNWIGRMAICKNNIIINKVKILPMLKASGYQTISKLAESNPNKFLNLTVEEYVSFDENLEEIGVYIISRAISDIECLGTISGVMNYFIQIYEQRLSELDKSDNNLLILKIR